MNFELERPGDRPPAGLGVLSLDLEPSLVVRKARHRAPRRHGGAAAGAVISVVPPDAHGPTPGFPVDAVLPPGATTPDAGVREAMPGVPIYSLDHAYIIYKEAPVANGYSSYLWLLINSNQLKRSVCHLHPLIINNILLVTKLPKNNTLRTRRDIYGMPLHPSHPLVHTCLYKTHAKVSEKGNQVTFATD